MISWDEGKGTVDTHHEDGRSYISAVSEVKYDPSLTCEGNAKVTTLHVHYNTLLHYTTVQYYIVEMRVLAVKQALPCSFPAEEELLYW